ncbi:thiamine pyrophosphate-dependent dehydrogenase E1 component subunit alpha [Bradyrhizobium sp. 5.13L]
MELQLRRSTQRPSVPLSNILVQVRTKKVCRISSGASSWLPKAVHWSSQVNWRGTCFSLSETRAIPLEITRLGILPATSLFRFCELCAMNLPDLRPVIQGGPFSWTLKELYIMQLNGDRKLEAYRRMLRIRRFEEEGMRQFKAGNIPGFFHSSVGQEAAIVGACLALQDGDAMTGTHRSHGHPIAKGAHMDALMAELMGKEGGICKGRGGSMHFADRSVGIISESAIVGGGIPIATGCAFSAKVRSVDQVTLCFFGDGAVNQGTFHESLNMASVWKLPVVYLCENNGYAISTSIAQSHGQPDIGLRAVGYGMPGVTVDGQDVSAVYEAVARAVTRARAGGGPTLMVADTYRFHEHRFAVATSGKRYRSVEEVEWYKRNRDPIVLYRSELLEQGINENSLATIEEEAAEAVKQAVQFALSSPMPRPDTLPDHMLNAPLVPGRCNFVGGLERN